VSRLTPQQVLDVHRTTRRWLIGSAIFGVVAWGVLFAIAPEMGWSQRLLAFGPLVIVPLALAAIAPGGARSAVLHVAAAYLQPIAGVLAAGSLLFPHGGLATGLAAPQVGLTVICFLLGRVRFSEAPVAHGRRTAADWAQSGALLYLLLGGGWLAVTRAGGRPFDFDPVIVLLAAVHFHYATLAPPILAGRVVPLIEGTRARRWMGWIVFALLAGPGLVGLGIIGSPLVAVIGTFLLTAGLFGLAAVNLGWVVRRIPSMAARVLLVLASLASLLTMPLACIYSIGVLQAQPSIDLLSMIRLHGMVNAFALAAGGLAAWVLVPPPLRAEESRPAPSPPPEPAPAAARAADAPPAG
jgi:hypothetical protein